MGLLSSLLNTYPQTLPLCNGDNWALYMMQTEWFGAFADQKATLSLYANFNSNCYNCHSAN